MGNPKRTKFNRMAVNHGGCPSFRHQKNKGSSLEFITESLRGKKLDKATLDKIVTIQKLPEEDRHCIMYSLDGLIQHAKNRLAYVK